MSLVTNACEGSGDEGAQRVEVAVRDVTAEHLSLVVSDDGAGVTVRLPRQRSKG